MGITLSALSFASCSKEDIIKTDPEIEDPDNRWITVSGALMQTEPGDGNGGTQIFSVTPQEAKDPNFSIDVFNKGEGVRSSRTARLQASADGKYLYNIQYTGADGGVFNKYKVNGGKNLILEGPEVETADYVSSAPRWLKAREGVGIAVRASAKDPVYTGTAPNFVYQETISAINVISLDLNDPKITETASFDLSLSDDEVAAGYYISRMDVPVINQAGDKVFIGVAVSKFDTQSFTIDQGVPVFTADRDAQHGWAKTLVLDYPSLANPEILSSDKTRGNTNGYRSTMQYVGTDGHVYQATSGEAIGTGGSKILRINSETNKYDNYVFSLDAALGLQDTYIDSWKYVGDGIGFVVYSLSGEEDGGYIARIDLNSKTAQKYNLPNEDKLDFRQIQNIAQVGDEVFIAVAPTGLDGNIYVFNKKTGEISVGAKLINKPGNRYIGVY